jgi:hypothetical protein
MILKVADALKPFNRTDPELSGALIIHPPVGRFFISLQIYIGINNFKH